ncbi:MAG TPA: multidrug efflux SMR transporter [Jiangellaceae bacterium]
MAWLLVIVGGLFETAFALFLKFSDGFTKLWPTVGFAVTMVISLGLLSLGLRELPVGTAYAVWTGIGATGTAIVGMLFLHDPVSVLRVLAISLIVGGVILLNLAGAGH